MIMENTKLKALIDKELKKKAMQQRMRPYIGDAETAGEDQ